ncbi:MAG: NuA4 histone H4 acetyltransferase complex and the SWR1 complex subunit [Watsoniomyces obsoletus]|nr:MAG: NuA4 histone H4 acetyltransferase complex and the SWR1 complex subunit [Watsoniomyces obsoletus]
MPAPAANKRVKGVSIYRPFVYGNVARPIDPDKRPEGVPSDHSHQWTVWVKGVNDEDISYWLRKVQFKLHDTYANSLRTIDQPPFEVTETGWGEFELTIKLYFVPESGEKAQTLWHSLKIHPYGPDAETQRAERRPVISQNYEEVIFNEPSEQFYEILTGGGAGGTGAVVVAGGKGGRGGKAAAGKGRGGKGAAAAAARGGDLSGSGVGRTAEIPLRSTKENIYSRDTEGKELDRMKEAIKKVDELIGEEREKLSKREALLESLRKAEGVPPKRK